MSVFNCGSPEIQLDYVKHRLKIDDGVLSRNKNFEEIIELCIDWASGLINPVFYYRILNIIETGDSFVRLEDGLFFESGFLIEKLGATEKGLVGVMTIGSGLENRGREVRGESGLLYSFIFDALGVIGMDMASKDFFRNMEIVLSSEGLYVGIPFSPGDTPGWNIEDQGKIYNFLADEIKNITINEVNVLIPKNSASFFVGLYDHLVRKDGDSNCTYCSMRDNCLYGE